MNRSFWRLLPLLGARHAVCRHVASLFLLVLVVVGLPTLSGAQQACQPDGDVNRDGYVTAADALLAFQQALHLTSLSLCQQTIADVAPQPAMPDGNITAADALCIFQKALSLPSCLDSVSPSGHPAPPGAMCLAHPNRPLTIARKPCGPDEGPAGTSIYLGSCCTDVCEELDMGQPQCPLFALRRTPTAETEGCQYWAHEMFGYIPLAACPYPGPDIPIPLREEVVTNPGPGEPSYVLAGRNASVQYWKDGDGNVTQGLYQSTDGTVSVRTFYDTATGLARTIQDEVSGNWLLVQERGSDSVDFWLYDRDGNYLGGFAVVEDDGEYSFGTLVGLPVLAGDQITGTLHPAGSSWTGSFTLEDDTADLKDVQDVPPAIAKFMEALASDGRTGARPIDSRSRFAAARRPKSLNASPDLLRHVAALLTPRIAAAQEDPYNVQSAARLVGYTLLGVGGAAALAAGSIPTVATFAVAGAAALVASAFVPDLAEGVKARCNAGGPTINPGLTRNLCALAGKFLAEDGNRGLIGNLKAVTETASEARDSLKGEFDRGIQALTGAFDGLPPGQRRERDSDEPGSSDRPSWMPSDLIGSAQGPDGKRVTLYGDMEENGDYVAMGTDDDGDEVSVEGNQGDRAGTGNWGPDSMQARHTSRRIPNWEGSVDDDGGLDLHTYFRDPAPSRGERVYIFEAANRGVVDLVLRGSRLMWTALREGTTWVTITATYPGPIVIRQRQFLITVTAAADPDPEDTSLPIPNWEGMVGNFGQLVLDSYFPDPAPSRGDRAYIFEQSNSGVADLVLAGSGLYWTAQREGTTWVTITATYPGPIVIRQRQFLITVTAAADPDPEDTSLPIPNWEGMVGNFGQLVLDSYFPDPAPSRGERAYIFEQSNSAVADLVLVGSGLYWTAQREGTTWVTITATYPGPIHIARSQFLITVTAESDPDPGPDPAPDPRAVCFTIGGNSFLKARYLSCPGQFSAQGELLYQNGGSCTTFEPGASEGVPFCPTWGEEDRTNTCDFTEAELRELVGYAPTQCP